MMDFDQNLILFHIPCTWMGNPQCSSHESLLCGKICAGQPRHGLAPFKMALIHVKKSAATYIQSASNICVEGAYFRREFRAVFPQRKTAVWTHPYGWDAPHSGVCIAFTDNMEQVKGHVHFHNQLSSASECTKMKDKATLQIDFIKKKNYTVLRLQLLSKLVK